MNSKPIDTIIIGAGISGLACAKQLQKHDRKFILISKNIGGRILTSKDGKFNYGAFFVCSDYYHVLKHVKIQNRIKLNDFCFHENNNTYVLFEPKLLAYLFQFIKTLKILYKFRKEFRKFREHSVTISQKKAIENNNFLYDLYMKSGFDFVKEKNLESGTETYLSKALYSTTFSNIFEMNAFSFLQFLLPLITPIYTFKFKKERMTESFKDKIVIDNINQIKFKNGRYKINSKKNSYYSKNIVLATEISSSKNFANIKKTNKPVSTHMLHIKGKPKNNISFKKYHLFSSNGNIQAIADLEDGTFLFYYKNIYPKLEKYFITSQLINSHFWDPAGTINGHTLIDSNRGKNMWLIGDYNVAGLEESYITGLYAANQIINLD